jgi:hypothetical protein
MVMMGQRRGRKGVTVQRGTSERLRGEPDRREGHLQTTGADYELTLTAIEYRAELEREVRVHAWSALDNLSKTRS